MLGLRFKGQWACWFCSFFFLCFFLLSIPYRVHGLRPGLVSLLCSSCICFLCCWFFLIPYFQSWGLKTKSSLLVTPTLPSLNRVGFMSKLRWTSSLEALFLFSFKPAVVKDLFPKFVSYCHSSFVSTNFNLVELQMDCQLWSLHCTKSKLQNPDL